MMRCHDIIDVGRLRQYTLLGTQLAMVLDQLGRAWSLTSTAGYHVSLRPMSRTSVPQVDVAIVGAGLAGLATAAAILKVHPDARVKVYDRRSPPFEGTAEGSASSQDASACGGGGVRLEMNGLRAMAAISKDLAAKVVAAGLYANRVLLHDIQGGAVMSRLHELPHPTAPSPRQPALVVGWAELEALLLQRLPPETVEWKTVVTSYTDSSKGVTLDLLKPSHREEAVASHVLSTAMTHALDVELQQHMDQQRAQLERDNASAAPVPGTSAAPLTPFSRAADGGVGDGCRATTSPFNGTGPAAAAAAVAAHDVLTAARLERQSVHATLLIAADGPLSLLRQQCVGDTQPNFEGLVRWVGRLPGDMLPSIPVDQEAWWLGPGLTFASHPLRNGDVAWEAQVSSSRLEQVGLKWDQQKQIMTTGDIMTAKSAAAAAGTKAQSDVKAFAHITTSAGADAATIHDISGSSAATGTNGRSSNDASSSSGIKRDQTDTDLTSAPAGEEGLRDAAASAVAPEAFSAAAMAQAAATLEGASSAPPADQQPNTKSSGAAEARAPLTTEPIARNTSSSKQHATASKGPPRAAEQGSAFDSIQCSVKSLLLQLFAGFPPACLDMIRTTDESVILEGPVVTRAARDMPACMGRGHVVVLGEAAHPVRPSGQEASQACEDAAELGAAVMACGIRREALRRFERRRRPRWAHAMQVSQAFGSASNLGGVALHQILLDYMAQLYQARFVPLHTVTLSQPPKRRNPFLHWSGVALVTYGAVAAAGLLHRHYAKQGNTIFGTGLHDPVAQAVVEAVDAVGQSAVHVAHKISGVVQNPNQTAAVLKAAAGHGVQATVEGSNRAAAVARRQIGKVTGRTGEAEAGDGGSGSSEVLIHGEAPPRHRKGVLQRVRDGVVKRTLAVGAVLSRPFTHVVGRQVRGAVAESLGAF